MPPSAIFGIDYLVRGTCEDLLCSPTGADWGEGGRVTQLPWLIDSSQLCEMSRLWEIRDGSSAPRSNNSVMTHRLVKALRQARRYQDRSGGTPSFRPQAGGFVAFGEIAPSGDVSHIWRAIRSIYVETVGPDSPSLRFAFSLTAYDWFEGPTKPRDFSRVDCGVISVSS